MLNSNLQLDHNTETAVDTVLLCQNTKSLNSNRCDLLFCEHDKLQHEEGGCCAVEVRTAFRQQTLSCP